MKVVSHYLRSFSFAKITPWVLLCFAFCYYGAYYRCSLYPAGEGGLEGVTALRLLAGERPITEVALNYNLLWFYPLVGLFKIFGPSYTLLRIFFFGVATLTGLLTFHVVKITTQKPWLAFLAGLLTLVLPGQLFRNYMAFIVMLNMAIFLKAFCFSGSSLKKHFLGMFLAGLSVGLAFLIRIDLGFFLSTLLLGLILFFPPEGFTQGILKHAAMSFASLCLVALGLLTLHLPFYADARERGFAREFVAQYEQWPHMLIVQAKGLLHHSFKIQQGNSSTPQEEASRPSSPSCAKPSALLKKSTLERSSLTSGDLRARITALNLYLPIPAAFLLLLIAGVFFIIKETNEEKERDQNSGCILLIALGCSLTLFPQYFFWRPDMVHLSEFMVPMTGTLLIGLALGGRAWSHVGRVFRALILCFLMIAVTTLLLYYINGCQSQSTGGIAISEKRTQEFVAANGVHVKLAPHEWEEATAIYQSVTTHSQPGEYVICFPYNPEINFMTNRPSYRRDFYCDDMTAPHDFDQKTIAEIEFYHPAVVVVTDWPINGTEHSRFSHWASETYRYLQSHYHVDYEKGIIHVFVRKESAHIDQSNDPTQKGVL